MGCPAPTQSRPAATAGAAGWPTIRASSAAATPTGQPAAHPPQRLGPRHRHGAVRRDRDVAGPRAAAWQRPAPTATPPWQQAAQARPPPPRPDRHASKRERAAHQRPVPADRPISADLEVGPAELVLDLPVALLDPVAQPIQPHDLPKLSLLGAARGGASQVAQQYQVVSLGSRSGRWWPPPAGAAPLAPAAQHRVRGHQVWVCPSRKRRVTRRHWPGVRGPHPSRARGRPRLGCGRPRLAPRCPCGLERQHERHACATQRLDQPGVVAVQAVGHHRPERDLGLLGGRHQLGGQLGLGPKPRIPLAIWQPRCRRVRHQMQRPVAARVRPQAGHRHDAVVGLADRPQVLAGHVGGVAAVLRSPVSSITSTPWACGAVAGSWHSNWIRCWLTAWGPRLLPTQTIAAAGPGGVGRR
jgi:hypothetical protein